MTESNASGELTHDYRWTYDHNNNVVNLVETVGDETFTYTYTYNDDQIATGVSYGDTTEEILFDGYGRTSSTTIKNGENARLTTSYTYNVVTEGENRYATNQIGTYTNTYGGADHNLTYTYDANGNILTVSDGTFTTTYEYDSLNQLLSEKNEAAGKSWVYTYDTGGNILTKTEYANATASGEGTVITYTYGDANWGDLLTTYNGNSITYDGSGNPLTMNGWNFTWQGGRQLAGMADGTTTLSFAYNEAGLRTSKTVGDTTHTYTYQGTSLVADKTASDTLYFHYDQNGSVIGFTYDNGTACAEYYYVKNLQSDVLGILDSSGALVASYTYDAWGNVLTVSGTNSALANRNPIRYRGYYYDTETELYYLRSRYYDAEVGRFINADGYVSVGYSVFGTNTYLYCLNNPIYYRDDMGTDATVLKYWASCMWWLCGIDGPFPVGEIIYVIGYVVLAATAIVLTVGIVDNVSDIPYDESTSSYGSQFPNDDDDDDDDYYDDDSNFGGYRPNGRSKRSAPRNNQAQNSQFDYVAKKVGLNKKQTEMFHRHVSGKGYSIEELFDIAISFK